MARVSYSGGSTLKRIYTIVRRHPILAGSVLVLVGVTIAIGAVAAGNDDGGAIGGTVAAFGVAIAYFGMGTWYCQNCGQRLGKINPRKCDRCQSNRIQKRDPGVGEAVRVKRMR